MQLFGKLWDLFGNFLYRLWDLFGDGFFGIFSGMEFLLSRRVYCFFFRCGIFLLMRRRGQRNGREMMLLPDRFFDPRPIVTRTDLLGFFYRKHEPKRPYDLQTKKSKPKNDLQTPPSLPPLSYLETVESRRFSEQFPESSDMYARTVSDFLIFFCLTKVRLQVLMLFFCSDCCL